MPTADEILAQLTAIARGEIVDAVLWHLAIAATLVTIALGWRPSKRVATLLVTAPLASVAAFAFAYGNPFNGIVFAAATASLVVLAVRQPAAPAAAGPRWASLLGLAMIAFAWGYPHFLEDRAPIVYLVAAPVGLVPCPSLALAIGGALLAGGLERRAAAILAALGLFYAVVGVARLGVVLDVGLGVGAVGLALTLAGARSPGTRRRRARPSRRTPGTPPPTRARPA